MFLQSLLLPYNRKLRVIDPVFITICRPYVALSLPSTVSNNPKLLAKSQTKVENELLDRRIATFQSKFLANLPTEDFSCSRIKRMVLQANTVEFSLRNSIPVRNYGLWKTVSSGNFGGRVSQHGGHDTTV